MTGAGGNRINGECAILGLIFAGTVGNLIDRLARGYVTDFIDIGPWPTFNVADSSMVCGVILLALFILQGASGVFSRTGEGARDNFSLLSLVFLYPLVNLGLLLMLAILAAVRRPGWWSQ